MGTKNKPGTYDCYANAHPDEPMFILLGRDPFAHILVDRWADLREKERGPSVKVEEARECAAAMRRWMARGAPTEVTVLLNGEERKVPPGGVTYARLVELAGMTGTPSVTWESRGGYSGGILHPGSHEIVPSEGMEFRVVHTGNA